MTATPKNDDLLIVIPDDRPVIGMDLDMMRSTTGFKVDEICWIMGINARQWIQYTKHAPMDPIPNPTVALLLRLYARKPHLIPTPPSIDPKRLLEESGLSRGDLSLMLGKHSTIASKWCKQGVHLSGNVRRLATHMLEAIKEEGEAWQEDWREMVETEAKLREIDDIWEAKSWK